MQHTELDLFERATLFDEPVARRRLLVAFTAKNGGWTWPEPFADALDLQQRREFDGAIGVLTAFLSSTEFERDPQFHVHATLLLARNLQRVRRAQEGLTLLEAARGEWSNRPSVELLALQWCIGQFAIQARRFPEALAELHKALALADELQLAECAARITSDIATATSATGDVAKSIALYEQALLTLSRLPDYENDCIAVRINLASLYQTINRNEDALLEYDALLQLESLQATPAYAMPTGLNRAIALKRLDRYAEALLAYKVVAEQARTHTSVDMQIRALLGMSDLSLLMQDLVHAREAAMEAVALATRHDVRSLVAETQSAIAAVDHAEGKIDEAIDGLRTAFDWTIAISDNNSAVIFGAELVQWLAEAHRFKDAYDVQRQCADLQRAVYEKEIERTVELSSIRTRLDVERETIRHRDEERNKILHAVLPQHIAERLMEGETRIADRIDDVTILFADIVGFTRLASEMGAESLVAMLEELFSKLDDVSHKHGCERLKTIGDSYMAICGVSESVPDHTLRMTRAAIEIMSNATQLPIAASQLRIGIHRGPVVAGVMSGARLSFDIWGDAVNVAARMEQHSSPGKIHCTGDVATALLGHDEFVLESREPIEIHGKGLMQTYWVSSSYS